MIGLIGPLLVVSVLALPGGAQADASDVTIDVAIDVDTTGNGDQILGPTDSCNETQLRVGDTIDVDVLVRGIPAYVPGKHTGIQGIDLDFVFDPAVVHVANVQSFHGPTILKAPGPGIPSYFDNVDYNWHTGYDPPGVTGDTFVSMISYSDEWVGGDGVLVRITLQAAGAGRGRLSTQYTLLGSPVPNIYDGSGNQVPYEANVSGATIVVGDGDCNAPTPTTFPFVTETPGPRPSHVDPTPTPIPIPNPPTVQTAIDVDTTGNGDNSLGSTESCNETPLQVGDTIDVDVVVRDVPKFLEDARYTGIRGFELDLSFDPAVLRVTNVEGLEGPSILKTTGIPSGSSTILYNYPSGQSPPGDTGDTFVSLISGSGRATDGDGVLTRMTLEAIHSGVSRLSLERTLKGESVPGIFEPTLLDEYAVHDSDAAIIVGSGDCSALPTPTPTRMPTPTRRPPTVTRQPPTTNATSPAKSKSPTPTLTPTPTVETARPTLTPSRLPDTGGPPDFESSVAYSVVALMGVGIVVTAALAYARRRV